MAQSNRGSEQSGRLLSQHLSDRLTLYVSIQRAYHAWRLEDVAVLAGSPSSLKTLHRLLTKRQRWSEKLAESLTAGLDRWFGMAPGTVMRDIESLPDLGLEGSQPLVVEGLPPTLVGLQKLDAAFDRLERSCPYVTCILVRMPYEWLTPGATAAYHKAVVPMETPGRSTVLRSLAAHAERRRLQEENAIAPKYRIMAKVDLGVIYRFSYRLPPYHLVPENEVLESLARAMHVGRPGGRWNVKVFDSAHPQFSQQMDEIERSGGHRPQLDCCTWGLFDSIVVVERAAHLPRLLLEAERGAHASAQKSMINRLISEVYSLDSGIYNLTIQTLDLHNAIVCANPGQIERIPDFLDLFKESAKDLPESLLTEHAMLHRRLWEMRRASALDQELSYEVTESQREAFVHESFDNLTKNASARITE